MHPKKLYITYGDQIRDMTIDLLTAADIAAEIPAGAGVALKPNLVVADRAENGATTHTEIVEGVIQYLQAHGHSSISIMEGSWLGDSTARAYSVCGYHALEKKYGVKLYDLKKDQTRTVSTPVGPMKVCCRAMDADYVISLPVLKGHCQTLMTCALKNSKGCIPDSEKRHFHTMGLHRPIAALATVFKPDLFIVDSICGDLNFEEGGTPIQTNRMLLGHDPVQIDAYGCRLMGIDPMDVDYIRYAEDWGVGSMEIREQDLVHIHDPADAPARHSPSGLVARLTRCVKQDSACSACFGNLVHALYRLEDAHGLRCEKSICIGQGYQGKTMDTIGIGRCCSGASVHVPGCPPSAQSILDTLLENL